MERKVEYLRAIIHEAICLVLEKKATSSHHLPLNDSFIYDPKTSPYPTPATVVVNVFLKCLPRCHLGVSTILPPWEGRQKLLLLYYKEMQMQHKILSEISHHLHHTPCWCQFATL